MLLGVGAEPLGPVCVDQRWNGIFCLWEMNNFLRKQKEEVDITQRTRGNCMGDILGYFPS